MRPAAITKVGILAVAAVVLMSSGCSNDTTGDREQVVVFAAASLTDGFAEVAAAFEEDHPGVEVRLNLAASSALRQQILEGAPADVFASADISNMEQVAAGGEVEGEPHIFAHNILQIAVPAGNPAGLTGLVDLADENLLIGLCAQGVPCGDLARQVLDNAGVSPDIDTDEPDVRALLTKIEAGELDAGIVYLTDVLATGGVEGVDIPELENALTGYPIATLTDAPNPDDADAFVGYVLAEEGQAILNRHGFTSP